MSLIAARKLLRSLVGFFFYTLLFRYDDGLAVEINQILPLGVNGGILNTPLSDV